MPIKNICSIVITFRPCISVLENIELLSLQSQLVYIIDNTPASESTEILKALIENKNCTVIRNNANLGIAAALNIGIRRAVESGFHWIATFDQDSKVCDGYFQAMMLEYERCEWKSHVGYLCPLYVDKLLGFEMPLLRDADERLVMCMTSGAMMRSETFLALGPMEEPLFIDYVDYEYCMRMRSAGLRILECKKAVLMHSLGRTTECLLFGRKMTTTNHGARRRYYIKRNHLVLIKRYWRRYPRWALHEFKILVTDSIKVILVESDKLAKAGYFLRAIYDGMLNRLGPRVAL